MDAEQWINAKHRNHAQMGIFSMFGSGKVLDRRRASKMCPDGHDFDVQDSINTEHHNYAQMGIFSMFGRWRGGEQMQSIENVSHFKGGREQRSIFSTQQGCCPPCHIKTSL